MKQLIVISNPTPLPGEANTINKLFHAGLQLLHLRKPDYSIDEWNRLIEDIRPEYYERIVLPAMLLQQEQSINMPCRKVHFSEYLRNKTVPIIFNKLKEQGYVLSTSIHAATTYNALPETFDYTFFSPVFDSISKQGYKAIKEEQSDVLKQQRNTRIIGLGGINEHNCLQALDNGFDGIAVLGAIWQSGHPVITFKKIQTCITNGQ